MSYRAERRLLTIDGEPMDRIHGFETEYGVTAVGVPESARLSRETFAEIVTGRAMRSPFNGVWSYISGQFTEDQDREYKDVGNHPEHSHAEEVVFANSALRVIAGHLKIAKRINGADVNGLRHSYFGEHLSPDRLKNIGIYLVANTCNQIGESWGCHENFLTPRAVPVEDYMPAFLAHRVSRIVWSGAGLPVATSGGDFVYHLSEKAGYMYVDVGDYTTHSRAIFNTRDEPLADAARFRRIHDISGESVFSPFTNGLRQAANDIIAAGCELGVRYGDLVPDNPPRAMRYISADPSLNSKVELDNGKRMTGLELQKALLERTLAALQRAKYMTDQRQDWAERWSDLLDDLEEDPMGRPLDWVMKKNIIDKKLSDPRGGGASDFDVAWDASLLFHRILPEGLGMVLLKRGKFEDSPPESFWTEGMTLPQTRAKLRAEISRFANQHGFLAVVDNWSFIQIKDTSGHVVDSIHLPNPYDSRPYDSVMRLYARLAARAA